MRPVLTRRRFLEHLGAVGGSSLVMTAMTSWDLMAGQAGVRPALTGRPPKRQGARARRRRLGPRRRLRARQAWLRLPDPRGARPRRRAGLDRAPGHGAHRNQRRASGLRVRRRPARERRPVAHPVHAHRRAELLQRARRARCRSSSTKSDASYFYYEGNAAGSLSNTRVRLREVKADMIGHTNELLVKAIDQRQLDLPLTAEDQQRFIAFLVSAGLPRFVGPPLQGVREPRSRGSVRLQRAAAVGLRQPDAIGSGTGRHRGGADVSPGRRHGPISQGVRARDRPQPDHFQRRGAVGPPGRTRA